MKYRLYRICKYDQIEDSGTIRFFIVSESVVIDELNWKNHLSVDNECKYDISDIGKITDGELNFLKKIYPNDRIEIKE